MPTIASSNIPPPKGWNEFEDITLSAAKLRFGTPDFYRYGRQGQKQGGVDIWGHDQKQRHVGIQCKNTVDGVTEKTVISEIENAESFAPKLDVLYIATTAKRDAVLQKTIRGISAQRIKDKLFSVDILFWDDLHQDLAKDEQVFANHYPQYFERPDKIREHEEELFSQLMELLPSDGVISFIDQTNMAGFSFRNANLDPLREFCSRWNDPEHEFLVLEIETSKKKLFLKAKAYLSLISSEVFSANYSSDFVTIPPEWEHEQPERFWGVVNQLHDMAGEIVALHRDFVQIGKNYLHNPDK